MLHQVDCTTQWFMHVAPGMGSGTLHYCEQGESIFLYMFFANKSSLKVEMSQSLYLLNFLAIFIRIWGCLILNNLFILWLNNEDNKWALIQLI